MIKGFLISWQNNENIYESNFKEILTSIKYLEVHMHVHEYSDMHSLTVYPEVSFLKAKKYIDLKSFRGQKMTPPYYRDITTRRRIPPPPKLCVSGPAWCLGEQKQFIPNCMHDIQVLSKTTIFSLSPQGPPCILHTF